VSCRIPLRRLTVLSGVSGSGKSSLAFDTLYAEGQRRYVVSLSTYARQFLERLPRPDVDLLSHVPPAIAIEQRNRTSSARSTVGTATEILDHLRLLYALLGRTHCPDCRREVERGTVAGVVERVVAGFAGQRVSLCAPLPAAGSARALRERMAAEGWTRVLDGAGMVRDAAELPARAWAALRAEALLVVDRLRVDAGPGRTRLAEAVANAFARGAGHALVVSEHGERASFREGFACDGCGRRFAEPTPALFSFNSPLGACETCHGFGRMPALDLERVVPDPARTLEGDAVAPFGTPANREMKRELLKACRRLGIPTRAPWAELSAEQQRLVVDGDGDDWEGVRGFFEWLESKRYKVQARVLIARYRRFDPCPDCAGARLRPDARAVRVAGRSLPEVGALSLEAFDAWLAGLSLEGGEAERAGRLLATLRARVDTALEVGLGYLSLDRQVRTLSGGEAQRIQLATALGGGLTAALYVLDEPSIGLHARDVARLLGVLRRIRDRGNTLVVVEHATEVVAAADHVIDLGPGAGRRGGELVVEGAVEAVRRHPSSQTARALRGEIGGRERRPRRRRGELRIEGASEHNLRDVDVTVPLGQLVAVTGVSGAGKSTLVRSVLVGGLLRAPERGACRRILGGEAVRQVVVVDPTPPARSARSNPATVSKAFEGIRRRFAQGREARALGLGPGWFSFNVPGGRCEACEGSGETRVEMQFLEDVRVPCERCDGTRYKPEARAIRVDGRSIVDVLALTLDEALAAFAGDPAIEPRLAPFARVGLGYLGLGQPLATLSGGEAQRLRLALALAEGEGPGSLFVLDEPTTGLHPAEVEVLVDCLDELIDAGGSALVVEHNLDLVRRADHVIDLGPEGGPEGGRVLYQGLPAGLAQVENSHTGRALHALT
jgi:excinuclease ABC subunit A